MSKSFLLDSNLIIRLLKGNEVLIQLFKKYPSIRYLFIGGINTIMSILVYNGLLLLHINYLIATGITNVFGVVEGFLLNSYIVFGHKPQFSGLLKYSTIYVISFVFNIIIMHIWVGILHMSPYFALYPSIALVTIFNYFLIKKFLFALKDSV